MTTLLPPRQQAETLLHRLRYVGVTPKVQRVPGAVPMRWNIKLDPPGKVGGELREKLTQHKPWLIVILLEKRCTEGFNHLQAREAAGDVGGTYAEQLAAWEQLVRQLEVATDRAREAQHAAA